MDAVSETVIPKSFAAIEKLLLRQQMLTCLILLIDLKYCHKISFDL